MSEKEEKFSYCVGLPWRDSEPDNLCIYTYGTAVFHGTLNDALDTRDFIEGRAGDGKPRSVYRLVKVEE